MKKTKKKINLKYDIKRNNYVGLLFFACVLASLLYIIKTQTPVFQEIEPTQKEILSTETEITEITKPTEEIKKLMNYLNPGDINTFKIYQSSYIYNDKVSSNNLNTETMLIIDGEEFAITPVTGAKNEAFEGFFAGNAKGRSEAPDTLAEALGELGSFLPLAKTPDRASQRAFADKLGLMLDALADKINTVAGDIVGDVLQKFEQLQSDPDTFKGIPTGFKRFDKITNGLQSGALIVLAARPGMGKTSLAMNIVEHAAINAGKTCAVFSLEMPRSEIVQRLICSYAKVSMKNALSGALSKEEWKKLMLAGDRLKKSNIYIDDSSRVTPAEIQSKCRRLKTAKGGVDLIMIDYIQLMSSGDSKMAGAENRQQEVASITRDLKIMAKELGVPVIALSQLRRITSNEPQLSDLRESGAIEQDADIVMFISRPEMFATKEELESGKVVKGAAELILAKHRAGEQGRVSLKFIGEYTKFVDVDDQNREDEPPQYGTQPAQYDDDDIEYEAPDDDYGYPEPPAPRKGDLKTASDDELPFE